MFDNVLFFVLAFMTVAGAVMVVLKKSDACLYFLLLSLIGTAGLYLTLTADFIAATQLLFVLVVLLSYVFAIMLQAVV